jgi:hypothetical protein
MSSTAPHAIWSVSLCCQQCTGFMKFRLRRTRLAVVIIGAFQHTQGCFTLRTWNPAQQNNLGFPVHLFNASLNLLRDHNSVSVSPNDKSQLVIPNIGAVHRAKDTPDRKIMTRHCRYDNTRPTFRRRRGRDDMVETAWTRQNRDKTGSMTVRHRDCVLENRARVRRC